MQNRDNTTRLIEQIVNLDTHFFRFLRTTEINKLHLVSKSLELITRPARFAEPLNSLMKIVWSRRFFYHSHLH